MALEPQLESPEPYALNQPPRSFYSSLTQELGRRASSECAWGCCAKARLAFSMTSCTTKQRTAAPTSITWQSLKVRSPATTKSRRCAPALCSCTTTPRRKSSPGRAGACVRGPLAASRRKLCNGPKSQLSPGCKALLRPSGAPSLQGQTCRLFSPSTRRSYHRSAISLRPSQPLRPRILPGFLQISGLQTKMVLGRS